MLLGRAYFFGHCSLDESSGLAAAATPFGFRPEERIGMGTVVAAVIGSAKKNALLLNSLWSIVFLLLVSDRRMDLKSTSKQTIERIPIFSVMCVEIKARSV
jgi:hypothetical protein